MLKSLLRGMATVALLFPLPLFAMQQAYLIQNSGWMEPFYTDPDSQYKPLIKAIIATTASQQDRISVAAFNQSLSGNPSPRLVYQGAANGNYAAAVDSIAVARKPGGHSFADTDLNEAIKTTIIKYFQGQPGIVWLFSNNKNSPGNSQDTARKNQDFYNLIHREPSISRALAFPLGMPVEGNHYRSSGAMIYALAYGSEAAIHLTRMQQSGQIAKVLNQAPARLKPLDADAVRLIPVDVAGNNQVAAQLARDQRSLILDVDAGTTLPVALIKARMVNDFSPYVIETARVSARFRGNGWNDPLPVSSTRLSNLKPGDSMEVVIKLPMPLASIPSIWSLSALASAGKQFTIPAVIEIQLEGQSLGVDGEYIQRLNALFPGDPLPAVFSPPEEVTNSIARIPVYLKVSYPLYPMLIMVLLVLIALGITVFLMRNGGSQDYSVSVNGERRKVNLGPFKQKDISIDGQVVAQIRRTLEAPRVTSVEPGYSVKVMK